MRHGTQSGLSVIRVPSYEAPGLAEEWNALHVRLGALPFMSHTWASSWWASMRRTSSLTRDTLHLYIVRDEADELIAVAPMMLTARMAGGLELSRTLQFIGADPNITEVRGPLVAPWDECRVVTALLAEIRRAGGYDRLIWSGLAASGSADTTMRCADGARHLLTTSMLTVPLPPSWNEFTAGLPRNTRESLRKCRNAPARDGHTLTFRVLDTPDALADALGHFFHLHRLRSIMPGGVVHRDCFEASGSQQFVRDVVSRLASTGRARLFQLEADGGVVAMRLGFVYGDGIYLYYSGYDPEWSRYSVMTALVAEILKHAIERGYRFANLSTGIDQSKLRWRPEETRFETHVIEQPSLRARVAIGTELMTTMARTMRDRARQAAR